MRILITNDDGINAPGLEVLHQIATELAGPHGEVWTVAPAFEQSGVGHCISDTHPTMVARLAERLEQRRLPIEEAETEIAEFGAEAPDTHLVALMQAIFDRIDSDRSALIAGIARYGRSQVDLSERIEERRARMAEMEAAEAPDFDAIDAEEKALDWDQRIFTERQQSLTYVCETPVILEQRIFTLGRAIAGQLD